MLRADPTFRRFRSADGLQVASRLPWSYQIAPLFLMTVLFGVFMVIVRSEGSSIWSFGYLWWAWGSALYFALAARNSVSIDVQARTYAEQKGVFPLLLTRRGSLDEFDAIVVESWDRSGAAVLISCLSSLGSYQSNSDGRVSRLFLRGSEKELLLDGRSPEDPGAQMKIANNLAPLLGLPVKEMTTKPIEKMKKRTVKIKKKADQ
jgi:hypothetical protein